MKKLYSVILSALALIVLMLDSFGANGQCNTSMAGTFIQKDSCNGFSQWQSSTVTIVSSTGTDIIINHFDDITPYYNATVTLDCNLHTATMPTQYPGQTTLWGSGTFTPDFNYMTLNYTVDFGTSTSTCIAKYSRQGAGIQEEKYGQNHLSVFPNPLSEHATLQSDKNFYDATLTVYNSFGQAIKQMDNLSGQSIVFYRDNLPSGLYFIRLVQDGKTFATDKLVLTDN